MRHHFYQEGSDARSYTNGKDLQLSSKVISQLSSKGYNIWPHENSEMARYNSMDVLFYMNWETIHVKVTLSDLLRP